MPFRSPLLPLERLRSSLERMAWLRLRTVHGQIAMARARQHSVHEAICLVRSSAVEQLKTGIASEQLRLDSVAALEHEQRRIAEVLEQLDRQRRAAEQEFLRCRLERRILENALALGRAAYEEERARKEQFVADDSFLQRISRDRQDLQADED